MYRELLKTNLNIRKAIIHYLLPLITSYKHISNSIEIIITNRLNGG